MQFSPEKKWYIANSPFAGPKKIFLPAFNIKISLMKCVVETHEPE
jgi:hypothetical protein